MKQKTDKMLKLQEYFEHVGSFSSYVPKFESDQGIKKIHVCTLSFDTQARLDKCLDLITKIFP